MIRPRLRSTNVRYLYRGVVATCLIIAISSLLIVSFSKNNFLELKDYAQEDKQLIQKSVRSNADEEVAVKHEEEEEVLPTIVKARVESILKEEEPKEMDSEKLLEAFKSIAFEEAATEIEEVGAQHDLIGEDGDSEFDDSQVLNINSSESVENLLEDIATPKNNATDPTRETIKRNLLPIGALEKRLDGIQRRQKAVVIVTSYRSGSSFLGQLFNQHHGVFYTFEPLFPLNSIPISKWGAAPTTLLKRYLKCNLPRMNDVYSSLKSNETVYNHNDRACMNENICFRYNSRILNEPDICPEETKKGVRCGYLILPEANEKCKKKVSVAKTIRIYQLEQLKPLFDDPMLDLKVIFLYRDPRAIANSRGKIHPTWNLVEHMAGTCKLYESSLQIAKDQPEWIKNRIKFIKYEDLAMKPFKNAEELLTFTGLKYDENVRKWIAENTQSGGGSKDNHFSTARDSEKVIQAWRTQLDIKEVLAIQNACKGAMQLGEYRTVSTDDQLRNLNNSMYS